MENSYQLFGTINETNSKQNTSEQTTLSFQNVWERDDATMFLREKQGTHKRPGIEMSLDLSEPGLKPEK